jgi:hypothetical protein
MGVAGCEEVVGLCLEVVGLLKKLLDDASAYSGRR